MVNLCDATALSYVKCREDILARIQLVLGPLPKERKRAPLDVQIIESVDLSGVMRHKLTYVAEPGVRVPAYLFLPMDRKMAMPAMVCLHPTAERGKDVPAGLAGDANRHYALQLAERGYVTLAPDCPPFGENQSDAYKLGYESVTMQAVWNHMRGVDLLAERSEVNDAAIGCIGHSHGGFNTLMLAVFDERIKVSIVSCGFDSFHDYRKGNLEDWSQSRYYMPKIATVYGDSADSVPFDFPEVLAAIAPRPLFINAPRGDHEFGWRSVTRCVALAAPVYKLFSAEENLVVYHPESGHDFPPDARRLAYDLIDKILLSPGLEPISP